MASGIPRVAAFASIGERARRRLVLACAGAVAFAAALVGGYPFGGATHEVLPGYYVLLFTTPALALLAMRFASARAFFQSTLQVAGRVVALSTLFGALNGVFGALGCAVASGKPGMLVIGTLFAVIFGAPTGLVYGLALAPLAAATDAWGGRDELDAAERLLFVCGAWVGAFALGLVAAAFTFDLGPVARLVALPLIAFAIGLLATGLVRRRRRAAWLARVRRGEERGFRVRAAAADEADTPSLVKVRVGAGDDEDVLEWWPEHDASAYRSGAPVAIARVPGPST